MLREANISFGQEETAKEEAAPQKEAVTAAKPVEKRSVAELYQAVLKTFMEQSEGWKKRNLFERQWVSRDFKKNTGYSIDEMQATLKALGDKLAQGTQKAEYIEAVNKVQAYYLHQQEQLKGFEKNPQKLSENLKIMDGWIDTLKP